MNRKEGAYKFLCFCFCRAATAALLLKEWRSGTARLARGMKGRKEGRRREGSEINARRQEREKGERQRRETKEKETLRVWGRGKEKKRKEKGVCVCGSTIEERLKCFLCYFLFVFFLFF